MRLRNPLKLRRPMVGWGSAPIPSFDVALQSSLLGFAAGSGTPTITRATTAYQTDFEGELNLALAGEARFQGARREENRFRFTEALTNAAWQLLGTPSVVQDAVAPDGTTTAWTITATANNDGLYEISTGTGANLVGKSIVTSVWIKRITGVGAVKIGDNPTTVPVTSSWARYSVLEASAPSGNVRAITLAASGDAVAIWHPSLNDVTGRANQNPPEYVSRSVLSAPYHGTGADGVKYFTTLNGNTVASNVVTEATGAAINSSQAAAAGGVTAGVVDASGPLGYLAEGERTNLALQSQTLQTTWSLSGINAFGAGSLADAYVAVDGTTTVDKLNAAAGNSTHIISQTIPTGYVSGTPMTFSAYVKYVNNQWIALGTYDGGAEIKWASFDILNGVVGAVTAGTTSTISPTAIAGTYRVSVTYTGTSTAAGTIYIAINTSDQATSQTWNAAGTELLGAWGAQLEAATFASSYIPTTTVAVQRNADVLTYPSAGNIDFTQGSAYGELLCGNIQKGAILYTAGGQLLFKGSFSSSSTAAIYDGTTTTVTANALDFSSVRKVAGAWSGSTQSVVLAGGAVASGAFDGIIGSGASITIGAASGSGYEPYGTIRNVRIYPTALPAARLQALTA